MKQQRNRNPLAARWIFGEYIVFAKDARHARQVYGNALNRRDTNTLFGNVELNDGSDGSWVQIVPKRRRLSS